MVVLGVKSSGGSISKIKPSCSSSDFSRHDRVNSVNAPRG